MSQLSPKKILLDTSFLITLFDETREFHENAKKYYKYLIENGITMYISAIVAAEYATRGDMEALIKTDNFIILPFNYSDGIEAGHFSSFLNGEARGDTSRDAAKDDVKILAQCSNNSFDFIITDDRNTMARYGQRLNTEGMLHTTVVLLNTYDTSIFREDGQISMLDSL